jgi:hypothetical protein
MLNKAEGAFETAAKSATLIVDKKNKKAGKGKSAAELKKEAEEKVKKNKENKEAAAASGTGGNLKEQMAIKIR